jgi:CspA family cold shock protein
LDVLVFRKAQPQPRHKFELPQRTPSKRSGGSPHFRAGLSQAVSPGQRDRSMNLLAFPVVPSAEKRRRSMKEQGVVKWFNGAKGYGFIQRSSGEDVFVHFSAIIENGYKTLNEGEAVEFECTQGPKGLSAANVNRVA